MVNPDCAWSKLERMHQKEGESVVQYDVIRSKILQSMHSKKLRGEAMVKRYTLQQLLQHAATKEDIDRQSQDM